MRTRPQRWIAGTRRARTKGPTGGAGPSRFAIFDAPLAGRRADGPASGSPICPGLTLFHDTQDGIFAWEQSADCALILTVYQFDGTYLSVAAAVEAERRADFAPGRTLSLTVELAASRPVTTYLRLNAAMAEGHDTLFETRIADRAPLETGFDLSALNLGRSDLRDAWVDIVFANPAMAEIIVSDIALEISGADPA